MELRDITITNGLISYNSCKYLVLIASITLLQLTPGTPPPNIALIDEVDDGETGYILHVVCFPSSDSSSTQGSTVSNLTLNSASSLASTLADSTIGSQHTYEKEGSKEGGIYIRTIIVYCNGILSNELGASR